MIFLTNKNYYLSKFKPFIEHKNSELNRTNVLKKNKSKIGIYR